MGPFLPLSLCDEHVAEVGGRVETPCVSSHAEEDQQSEGPTLNVL